jgi:hypothetical protein
MLYNEMLGVVSVKLGNAYTNYSAVNGQCNKKSNVTLASMWKKSKATVISDWLCV